MWGALDTFEKVARLRLAHRRILSTNIEVRPGANHEEVVLHLAPYTDCAEMATDGDGDMWRTAQLMRGGALSCVSVPHGPSHDVGARMTLVCCV